MKYSLHAFMSMQSFCIYHIYPPHTFSNLPISVPFTVSQPRSRRYSEIFGRCHSSRPSPNSFIFRLPANHPLVNRCKQKMQVALSNPFFFFKTSFVLHLNHPVRDSSEWKENLPFPKASKQSEQNNSTKSRNQQ